MESKRSALLANNNYKLPNMKKTKFVSEYDVDDFGPWFSQPSKKLVIIAKKSFKKGLRRTRYQSDGFGPWFSHPFIKLSIIAKKSFKKALRRKRYQSDGPRVHYLTTAGHTLPIDLAKAMEQAGVLIKKVNAGSDDYDTRLDLELAERCIDRIAGFRKCARHLPSDWKYDRATAILFAP